MPHRIALGSEFLRQGEGLHPDGAGFTLELGFSRSELLMDRGSPKDDNEFVLIKLDFLKK